MRTRWNKVFGDWLFQNLLFFNNQVLSFDSPGGHDVDRDVLTDTASLHQPIRLTGCVSPFN